MLTGKKEYPLSSAAFILQPFRKKPKYMADSIVLGESEEVWPRLVEDARTGNLKPFYRQKAT